MANTNSYEYVSLDEKNIHELIPLYKNIFGVRYTLAQIKAKYQPSYTGIHAQGHFAFFNKKAVAFHGAIPVLMRYKNQIELCAQYGDAMTLADHSGNGLFTKLGELTDQTLQDNGVKFVWGFPNQNSEYGYVNKLNWQGKERMQCYIFKLNPLSSEVIYRKTKIFNQHKQERIKSLLSSIIIDKKDLQSIDKRLFGGIERSSDFYRYKSFSTNYFVNLNGTKVWIKPVGGLLVGDLEFKTEANLLETINDLKALAKQLGLNKVVIQTSPNTMLNNTLKKHFQSIDSWLIGYKNFYSKLPLDQLQFTYGDLDTF